MTTTTTIDRMVETVCGKNHRLTQRYLTAVRMLAIAPLTEEQRSRVAKTCIGWLTTEIVGDMGFSSLPGVAGALGIGLVISVVGSCSGDSLSASLTGIGVAAALLALEAPVWLLYEAHRWYGARAVCAHALGSLRAPEGIPALLAAAYSPLPRLRYASEEALIALLGSVDLTSTPELSWSAQRSAFRLLSRDNESLQLAILDLLEHRGGGQAWRPVEALAARGRHERVRLRAAEVLQVLKTRGEEAQNNSLLLRASSAGASPETLLRAGHATTDAPAELLRAGERQEQERVGTMPE